MKKTLLIIALIVLVAIIVFVFIGRGDNNSTGQSDVTGNNERRGQSDRIGDPGLPNSFSFQTRRVLLERLVSGKSASELSAFFESLNLDELLDKWYQLELSYLSGSKEKIILFGRGTFAPQVGELPTKQIRFSALRYYNNGSSVNEKGEIRSSVESIRQGIVEEIKDSKEGVYQVTPISGFRTILGRQYSCEKREPKPETLEADNIARFYTVEFWCFNQFDYPALKMVIFVDYGSNMVRTSGVTKPFLVANSEFAELSTDQEAFASRDMGTDKTVQPTFNGRPAGSALRFSEDDYEFMINAVAQISGISRGDFEATAFRP